MTVVDDERFLSTHTEFTEKSHGEHGRAVIVSVGGAVFAAPRPSARSSVPGESTTKQ
jgi:hypothetical protein